jgi:hypothetical protein
MVMFLRKPIMALYGVGAFPRIFRGDGRGLGKPGLHSYGDSRQKMWVLSPFSLLLVVKLN